MSRPVYLWIASQMSPVERYCSDGTMFPAALQRKTEPAAKDDPIICRKVNVGDEVGTHMLAKKKVCMHKSERDYIDQHEKQSVLQMINDGNDRMRFIPRDARPPR